MPNSGGSFLTSPLAIKLKRGTLIALPNPTKVPLAGRDGNAPPLPLRGDGRDRSSKRGAGRATLAALVATLPTESAAPQALCGTFLLEAAGRGKCPVPTRVMKANPSEQTFVLALRARYSTQVAG